MIKWLLKILDICEHNWAQETLNYPISNKTLYRCTHCGIVKLEAK